MKTSINARLDRLEQMFHPRERPKVRKEVVGDPKEEEDSTQNESDSNSVMDRPRRVKLHGQEKGEIFTKEDHKEAKKTTMEIKV